MATYHRNTKKIIWFLENIEIVGKHPDDIPWGAQSLLSTSIVINRYQQLMSLDFPVDYILSN